MSFRIGSCVCIALTLIVAGCSKPTRGGLREKTFPLTGLIEVDGTPAEGVEVQCNPDPGNKAVKYPVSATTDKDGRFTVATYQKGDGLPAGKYVMTFSWMEPGLSPKDRLKGAYTDPKKSKHSVTITEGEKTEVEDIALSTKPSK